MWLRKGTNVFLMIILRDVDDRKINVMRFIRLTFFLRYAPILDTNTTQRIVSMGGLRLFTIPKWPF